MEQRLGRFATVAATLGTALFGAAIGYWNSIAPYLVHRDLGSYDNYFDGLLMITGAVIGLTVGGFATSLHRLKLVWVVSILATAGAAAGIPFLLHGLSDNDIRESVGWISPLVFMAVHGFGWFVQLGTD